MPKLLFLTLFRYPYAFFFLVLLSFPGCMKGTVKHRAILLATDPLSEAVSSAFQKEIAHEVNWITDQWWTLFDDPQLTCCIETALSHNPSIQITWAALRQTCAYSKEVRSKLLPSLNWGARYDHFKLSRSELSPEGLQGPLSYDQLETLLDFHYEIDLWGKNRAAWQASKGLTYAKQAEIALTQLMLSVAVAQNYFSLQTVFARKQIAKQLLTNREQNLLLIQQQIKQNIANAFALEEAKKQINFAQELLYFLKQDEVIYKTNLQSLLANGFCQEFAPIQITKRATIKVPIPSSLPCDLLARRAEIFAQKWRIYSAFKEVEVAKALFYPNIDLFAIAGFRTIRLTELFQGRSYTGDYGGALHLPLFDGGWRMGNLRYQEEEVVLRIEEYNELVLQATKEALQGIYLLTLTRDSWQTAQQIQNSTAIEYELSQQKFKHNVTSTFPTLSAEEVNLIAQDRVYVAQEQTLLAILALVKAIGGGYDSGCR